MWGIILDIWHDPVTTKFIAGGGGATFVQAAPPALEALSGMAWGLYRRRASCKALQPVYRWQGNLHYSSVGVTSLVGGKAFIFIQVDLTETLDTAVSMWEFQMYYFLRGASDLGGLWHQRGPWKFWSLTRNLIGGLGNGNVTLCVQVQVVYTHLGRMKQRCFDACHVACHCVMPGRCCWYIFFTGWFNLYSDLTVYLHIKIAVYINYTERCTQEKHSYIKRGKNRRLYFYRLCIFLILMNILFLFRRKKEK